MLYSLNDFTIIPAGVSYIKHRKDCNINIKTKNKDSLPIFAAPMSCVINEYNYKSFEEIGINVVIPRSVDYHKRIELSLKVFVALGLEEFKTFIEQCSDKEVHYICVDVANGHMSSLMDICKKAKTKFKESIQLMVGNIANPETYFKYANIADFIRIGIGSGNVCTTSANSGIHFPMGSLLKEISFLRNLNDNNSKKLPKIIADGGFKNFDQINKALVLGADYVMLGEILAKSEEACGELSTVYRPNGEWSEEERKYLKKDNSQRLYLEKREYYGMSTKMAQIEFGGSGNKTAEGIFKEVIVEYPISKWVDNFSHYLRSAMSYTNSRNLKEFKAARCEVMSSSSYYSYFK